MTNPVDDWRKTKASKVTEWQSDCFSVVEVDNENHGFRVLNFGGRNLRELEERGIIQWPIDIMVIEERYAVIHDARIPPKRYSDHFCNVCCPEHLLPPTQRLRELRDLDSGMRVDNPTEFEGKQLVIMKHQTEPGHRRAFLLHPDPDKKWYVAKLDHWDHADVHYWSITYPMSEDEAREQAGDDSKLVKADTWKDAVRAAENQFGGHQKAFDDEWPTMSAAVRMERYGH